ncbi:hypothetical protein MKY34_17100 [Sporosarcina sp. FSL K6-1522]|uniref:hypothetical protein n=1 Tax=Sporosarcina sp. FSL K6-1522 TaxID=2921554 RepID=UPI00315A7E79
MEKGSRLVGIIAGLVSVFLWGALIFFNPYGVVEASATSMTFVMLLLPACLAIIAAVLSKKRLMLLAFLWSFPISAYVAMTPSYAAWFGLTSLLYFVSFLGMMLAWRKFWEKAVYSHSY